MNELLERTERAIADLEARNEAGDDPTPVRLPERLADRETLRRQVRQAMDQLDARGRNKRRVNEARQRWINPPEWVREEPDVVPSLPPRLLPVDEEAEREMKRRTLTNLYNQRPTWLAHLHNTLDAAVSAAYGWEEAPGELGEEELLGRLLALNLERAE